MKTKHKPGYWVLMLLAAGFLMPCLLLILPLAGEPLDSLWGAVLSPDYLRGYGNTLVLALAGAVIQVAVALPAGYALERYASKGTRKICLVLCGLLMLLPQQALMLPQYLILQKMGLLDTLAGLLVVTAFQPWMVLLFWFGTSRVDQEIFDAAACDGAAGITFLRRIYLPLMAPYLAAAALLSGAESWNLLEQPMIFLQQKDHYPLSILLSRLPEADQAQKLFGGVLFLLPLVIAFGVICSRIRKNSSDI